MRVARLFSAYSSTTDSGCVSDVSAISRIEKSAGFTFRSVGGVGSDEGSWRAAAAIADCTSCAAASMLRSSENCSVIDVLPLVDVDVIESMPAMVENCFSSGVATADAMVSALAPGSCAETWIVGKSTFGSALTGSSRYPTMPKMTIASMTRSVMTGRRTNCSEIFMRSTRDVCGAVVVRSRAVRIADRDSCPGGQTQLPGGDHGFAGRETRRDDGFVAFGEIGRASCRE